MMAAQREKGRTLQLLVLFGLLSLSRQFEVTEDEWKELGPDMTALHRLYGPSEHMLWNASNTRSDGDHVSFLDGFQECGNVPAGVKKQQDLGVLRASTEELNPVPQREVDPSSQYDHQQIIMLQDDEVVRKAASFLYEKHPAVSSVYVLDNKQKVRLIGGKSAPLSENSRLVLVGHGARDQSGEMKVSGFSYGDVSSIIQSTSRVGSKIRTTRVLACEVGSDQRFIESLLKELHGAGIETELHLWNAVIQVTRTGHVISQDVSPDGPQWRLNDGSRTVVAALHRNGEMIRRRESGSRGEQVFTEETNFLKPPTKKPQVVIENWPEHPQRFINPEVYNKMDQNKFGPVEEIKKDFDEVEGLTWGMFHSNQQTLVKVGTNLNIKKEFLILDESGKEVEDEKQKLNVINNCYEINSGARIRDIIRHYGKNEEKEFTYLMVNNWIFLVNPGNLYVYPAGKRLDQNEREAQNKKDIMKQFERQKKEDYTYIRGQISDKGQYPYYVTTIFKGESQHKPSREQLFLTWYFTASVIAESARNFRTFPLTLMVLDMIDSKELLLDDHPMARGSTWINNPLRGFKGTAGTDESGKTSQDTKLNNLKEVLETELKIFRRWKGETDNSGVLDRMTTLINEYNILDNQFQENYNNFKNQMNSASG